MKRPLSLRLHRSVGSIMKGRVLGFEISDELEDVIGW